MSWLPQEKQRLVLSCPYEEILFGGAAGGGKSSALLMDAQNHIIERGDMTGRKSNAVLFRKTYKELDEIIKQSHECFEGLGWKFSKDNYRWTTPYGSNLTFSYLSNYQDALSHRGFEYDWCVARGSMIVMADGSRKPVELVCVGDMVMTMFGPCRVSVTPPSRVKRVWRVRTGDSDSLISEDHKILTTGGWESPLSLLSKLYRGSSSTDGFAIGSYLKTWQHPWLRQEVTPQVLSPHLQTWAGIDLRGNAVWSVDGRSAYAGYCASHQDISQLQGLSVQLVLHAPSAHQSQEMLQYAALSRGDDRDQIGLELGGFPNDCPIEYHFDGEQPRCQGEVYQAYTQPQVYAVGNNEWRCGWDGQEKTPEYAHFEGRISLNHPYTNKRQDSSEDALLCQAWLDPAGEAEVFDLRICGASHYLLHSGIISQNCGFDELTLWPTDEEYEYLGSRLRHTTGRRDQTPIIPRRVCTTNPGGAGHDWVKKRWGVGSNPNGMKPMKEEIKLEDGRTVIKTRIFIPSRLRDNYYLYSTGQYEAELRSKPENVRKMLLDGRWDVVEGAFFTEWDPNVHVIRPFNPPADWHRVMGADWGTRSPYCFLWLAMNPNGEIFVYRELYGEGNHETAAEVAPKIRRFEQMADEDIRERWLDSSCFDKQGNEESIADVFGRLGLHFEPSKKQNKKFSIDRLRDYLKVVNGKTAVHFMESCPNLIRTLPTLQVDRSNFDQFDSTGEDHACISGNTTVATNLGHIRAVDLAGKHFGVLTPGGVVMDCLCAKTGEKMVYEVLLSNGERLECTDDHRLLTAGGGFVQLKHLLTCDILAYGGQDGCAGLIANGAEIQRGELLSVREILSAQRKEAPPSSLEVPQRPSPEEASHPSFGWGPGEQPITEPEIDAWARSLVLSHDDSRKTGVEPGEYQEGYRSGSGLARIARGPCLAYGTREGVGGQGETPVVPCPTNHENLLHVHGNIREQGGFVLLQSSLQNASARAWHYGVRIEAIRVKAVEPVYDIGVPFAHCYTLGSGVVAHNCDALLYGIRRGQKTEDENARSHRAKMLNQARMARFGQYGAQ